MDKKKKVCCVCGGREIVKVKDLDNGKQKYTVKNKKAWRPIGTNCLACSDHCENWAKVSSPGICPHHKVAT